MNASSTITLRIHHGLMTAMATTTQMALGFHANQDPNDLSLPGRIARIGADRMKIVRAANSPPMTAPAAIEPATVHPELAWRAQANVSSATMSVASALS
jgi:hypothetical protein